MATDKGCGCVGYHSLSPGHRLRASWLKSQQQKQRDAAEQRLTCPSQMNQSRSGNPSHRQQGRSTVPELIKGPLPLSNPLDTPDHPFLDGMSELGFALSRYRE